MQIDFFELTHQGARTSNQDAYAHTIAEDFCFFVVADGLGGHFRGDIASSQYTQALNTLLPKHIQTLKASPIDGMAELMLQAWKVMSAQVMKQYHHIDSQTTIAVLWFDDKNLITAHVGDSRIYLLNQEGIMWRTPDHTPVQMEFEQGKITEEDFNHHPLQNRLLRTVNLYEPPEAEIYLHPRPVKGDTLLLCSDGFWNFLTRNDIALLGKVPNMSATATKLLEAILLDNPQRSDNITLQLIRII